MAWPTFKMPERAPEPERPKVPEAAPETAPEPAPIRPREAVARPIVETPPPPAPVAAPSVPAAPAQKDPEVVVIENILAEDLAELYAAMPPELQAKFRAKGEETASKIQQMIRGAKVQAKRIVALIKDWLRLIPGVNKFFLEQEAKIKTDRILSYSEKKERGN